MASALDVIRTLAGDSRNVVVVTHAGRRQEERSITRLEIERCLLRGQITEGPYVNIRGHWQVNLTRSAAGESLTCAVAIEWNRRLVVITAFRPRN